MTGIDPIYFMQTLAGKLDQLSEYKKIQRALDDMEYLLEVLDPELQEPAYELVEKLRQKLSLVQQHAPKPEHR